MSAHHFLSPKQLRSFLASLVLAFLSLLSLQAQEIITAPAYFEQVSQNYTNIQDYIADIRMTSGNETMQGTLYYRLPNRLRIDFSSPVEQVLVSNGSILQVYVPRYNVTLVQTLDPLSSRSPGGLATPEGLSLLRQNYSIAFKTGPDPVPLDDSDRPNMSQEPVVKLLLRWRNTNEGFREIELAINADLMIRRITGITLDNRTVEITFNNIRLNQNIPEARFEYESPSSSNNFNNFLFGTEN